MHKIAIIGNGAVGSTIAYNLKSTKYHIELLGRNPQTVNYISNEKPIVTDILEVKRLSECTEQFDVIFIAVKIPQLASVLSELNSLLHENSIIILAQNGYGQLTKFQHPFVYQAVVYISGRKIDDTVTHYRDNKLILKNTTQTQELSKHLDHTGLDITLTDDIEEAIWYKLLVNLAINSVTALSRSTAAVLSINGIKTLCEKLLNEGIEIAKAENINFDDNIINDIIAIYQSYPSEMGTSMYYDILEGKPLEIEGIQGFLYRKAKLYHLDTPILDTIYPLLLAQQKS